MKKDKPLVVVLSRNYSTGLGVIRSLGNAGYTVDLIASVKKKGSSIIISSSKYIRNTIEIFDKQIQGNNGDSILNAIMKYRNNDNKVVLFPTDDFTAKIVADNYDKLKDSFLMPKMMDEGSVWDAMDKSYQRELAIKAGINVAKECVINLQNDIEIPDNVDFPCFVKPAQSVAGSKAEMKVCSSNDELHSHLKKMKAFFSDRNVIVQDFLAIDKEYDLSGLCLGDEIIIPAIIEKSRIAKYEPGVTMSGTIKCNEILGDEINKIENMLKSLGYFGMFDMEIFSCNGRIYFNEINLRSGGPNYSYFLNGVNLPDIFVKELCGEGHSKDEEIIKEYGKTFVYEKVAWEDYIHSFLTKKEMKECINSADYTLLADKNDTKPNKVFYKRIRLSAMKHKILIALGRE